jgi:ferredoxin
LKILYFTATGNNLYLAKRIGGNLISIPKAVKQGDFDFSDDAIGLVFPIYGLSVPPYIREFLKQAWFDSNYLFAVMSYGRYDGAAASHLQELGVQNGLTFSYINTIQMVDNYLPGFQMEKEIAEEPKKDIETNLCRIIADIEARKKWLPQDMLIDRLATRHFQKYDRFQPGTGLTDDYRVDDKCFGCGTCARVCPTNNIAVTDAKPVFGDNCLSCLACTQNCPHNAIWLLGEKSSRRFRNQYVSLKEIIKANE